MFYDIEQAIDACDEDPSLVFVAIKNNYRDVYEKVLEKEDFDFNLRDENGLNVLMRLIKNKDFLPNIKNNNGETILDRSINNNYIYTSIKILEDKRFNNIDIASFKKLYDTYIKTNKYGKYTKMANLEIIMDSLENKDLVPRMKKLVKYFKRDYSDIKNEVLSKNKTKTIDGIIKTILIESNS